MKTNSVVPAILLLTVPTLCAQTATWTDAAVGQYLYGCDWGSTYYASNNHHWTQEVRYGANCDGDGNSTVRDVSNWDTAAYPDGTGIDVVINSGAPVELSASIDIANLTIGSSGQLNFNSAGILNVHGGTIQNDGLINLVDASSSVASLKVHANTSLNGTGTIIFNSNDDCWIESATAAAEVLTVGPSQTLLAPAVAIAGTSKSKISAAMTNNGTITADEGGLLLDTFAKTNNNIIQAINGGNINIDGIAIDNTNGTITAGAGSTVNISGVTLNGGLLNGPGLFAVGSSDATFTGNPTLAPGSTIELTSYDQLTIDGTLTNNGEIRLNDDSGDVAYLTINGNTTLAGSGRVYFVSNDDNWITSTTATDILTIGENQTLVTSAAAIAGASASRVMTAFVNEGTITADEGGLRLDTHDKTNNSTMQAINGGLLQFSGITINNTSGTISADAASSITLDNTTIIGGMLDGDGTVDVLTTDATLDAVTIGADLTVDVRNYDILHLDSSITNNGRILLTDAGSDYARLRINTSLTLNGSGEVVFNNSGGNVIDSSDPAHVLSIGPDQDLTTSNDSSPTWSSIETATINNGTITAATGGLKLSSNDKTNNSLIQTTGGGTIRCSGITLDNSMGTIAIDTDGTLQLDGCTISGGLISGSGTVDVFTTDATLANGVTIGPDITVAVGNNDFLTLQDTITNNGTMTITDTSSGYAAITVNGPVMLEGSGEVVFNNGQNNVINSADPAHILTIGPDQEITTSIDSSATWCVIQAATVNNGTITAATGGLKLDSNDKTNNSLIQTTGGGTLRCTAITIDNTGGTISLDPAGTLLIDGATISGGLIDGSGTVDVQTSDGTLENGVTIGPDVTVASGNGDILTLKDTVTNNGTMTITDNSAGVALITINGPVSLEGSGRIVFNEDEDNILSSANAGDVLTVGAAQTLTTSPDSRTGRSFLDAATVNSGIIEGNGGGLSFRTNPKTNNGIFRATNGGELEILTANTLLTNYNHATGTLTGGRWEVSSTDSTSVMDLQGAAITTLAPGTEVIMTGALSSFPALMLDTVSGSLAVNQLQVLDLGTTDVTVDGTLEFGLTDGATDGWDATRIDVDGNVNLTGSTINITGQGLTPGTYELIHWTGTLTGTPTLGTLPAGFSAIVSSDADSLNLTVTRTTPVILGIDYDIATNTVTITYESINGVVFGVNGADTPESMSRLPDTERGDGTVKQYQHHPESGGAPMELHFYQFLNPATDPA